MRMARYLTALLVVARVLSAMPAVAEDAKPQKIDASDPTRIYTYVGFGPKFTRYANGETMWEARISGNIGLKKDMIFFNTGYGKHNGNSVPGASTGLTNSRVRWFHLPKMDYTVTRGYRGWATQIDVQLAGYLKGTDGQSVLSFGALPAYGLGNGWNFYLPVNVVNVFDNRFESHKGSGLNVSPLFVYVPDNWWNGAYIQFWPGYTRFLSGGLNGTGASNLDITIGGKINERMTWTLLTQFNGDENLAPRGRTAGLANDWNTFFFITRYF